jgi:transcriptional regulator with XRE-family HTH domain
MLGGKLRELREAKGLVQRQVAAELQVDTAYISKMESNEKPVSRRHIKKLSLLLEVNEQDLYTHWLADKVYSIVKGEALAYEAMQVAESYLAQRAKERKRRK